MTEANDLHPGTWAAKTPNKPAIIIAGGSAYSRIFDFAAFREIADSVGAYLLVDMAHFAGLVAGGVHPNPFPHAQIVTTTTHKTMRGARGGMVLTNDEAIAKKINSAIFPGLQGGPLMHVIAAKAVAFGEALDPSFNEKLTGDLLPPKCSKAITPEPVGPRQRELGSERDQPGSGA